MKFIKIIAKKKINLFLFIWKEKSLIKTKFNSKNIYNMYENMRRNRDEN